MFLRKKIPCYVVIFDQVEIIKKTLDFLTKYSDRLDIVLIENPSDNSTEIKKIVDGFGQQNKIARHYVMNSNIAGNAFTRVLESERDYIAKSKYIYLTDGDITVKDNGWISEQKKILDRHKEIFASGVSMEKTNLPLATFPDAEGWIPTDMDEQSDYYEAYTGAHLLLFRADEFLGFLAWREQEDLNFVDVNLHKYCYEVLGKKWSRTKKATCYHLTWDLYLDLNHPYTKMKLSKSFASIWHHGQTSDFTLIQYSTNYPAA